MQDMNSSNKVGKDSPCLIEHERCAPSSGSDSSINSGAMRMSCTKKRRNELAGGDEFTGSFSDEAEIEELPSKQVPPPSTSQQSMADPSQATTPKAKPAPDSSTAKNDSPVSSSTSSDHTDRDGINWGSKNNRQEVRSVKDYHDSVIHDVVLDNNPERLRDMLKKGLAAYGKSQIDGATPLHRAAEIGSIGCAEVLLEFKVDIDVTNLTGQTAFHVAALNSQINFGSFLLDKKAKNDCQKGKSQQNPCTKCRYLVKMIHRKKQNEDTLDKQKALEQEAS